MKIVVDKNIPYLKEALERAGHCVTAMPGTAICKSDVADADALFVRTRTRCGRELLEGTGVRFIGTATIGYDHIDAEYCKEKGITWCNAPGCNAGAVLQYVQSVIYARYENVEGLSLGVVGVGEVGSRVAEWAEAAGMKVYRNDPPKAAAGMLGLVSLEEIAEKCDIITFHPTLVRDGRYPSWHLAGEAFFASLRHKPLVINASRGPVVDGKELLAALERGMVSAAALDVWEGEPDIDRDLLDRAWVATPHIAGYSLEGKYNATRMVLDAFAAFAGNGGIAMPCLPGVENPLLAVGCERDALLGIYNPMHDTSALKNSPCDFENQRNNYALRREVTAYEIVVKG